MRSLRTAVLIVIAGLAGVGWLCGCSAPAGAPTPPAGTTSGPGFHDADSGVGITPPPGWTQLPRPPETTQDYIASFARQTSPAGTGLVLFGSKADAPLDPLVDEFLGAIRAQRPELQEISREPVTVATGQAGRLVTAGIDTRPESVFLAVVEGSTVYVAAGHLPPADYPRDGSALRTALLSLTIDPLTWSNPELLRNVAIGVGAASALLVTMFGVVVLIWLAATKGRRSGIPGWVWITPCVLSLVLISEQREHKGPYGVATDFCVLVLIVTSITVAIRKSIKRQSRQIP
jgi:hypothetical protein